MNRLSILAVATNSFLVLGASPPTGNALGQQKAQGPSDVDSVNTASQVFIAAISARDISAMDEVWAHEPYATFIGPLSTTVVVGWEGVRKAWEMRFGQFDRLQSRWLNRTFILMEKSHGRSASRRLSSFVRTATLSVSMRS